MPENQYVKKTVTLQSGQRITLDNQVAENDLVKDLESRGVTDFKNVEKYQEPYKPDMISRAGGAVLGAGTGMLAGGPIGGVVGAVMGGLMPPETPGQFATEVLSGGVGKLFGKGVQAASKLHPLLGGLARSGAGLAEAEGAHALTTGIDTGKPRGFNPLSLPGIAATAAPQLGAAFEHVVGKSPGVANRKLTNMAGSLKPQLTHSNLLTENLGMPNGRPVAGASKFAENSFKDMSVMKETTLQPYMSALDDLRANKTQLETQMENLKTTGAQGLFSATQQGANLNDVTDKLNKINAQLDSHVTDLAAAEVAQQANKTASRNMKKTGAKTGQTQAEIDAQKTQGKAIKYVQSTVEEKRLQSLSLILNDDKLSPTQRRQQIEIINNQFAQEQNQHAQNIGKTVIAESLLTPELRKLKATATQADRNIDTNSKFQAGLKSDIKTGNIEAKNLSAQKTALESAQKQYYKQAQDITGVSLDGVDATIKHFETNLKGYTILPREVKALVDASGSVDNFVQAAKGLSTQELNTAMNFLPAAQQAAFKKNVGDAVLFDFFARSYDPATKMYTNAEKYRQQFGLPNVEFFTGTPDANRRFSELTQTIIEAAGKENSPVRNMLTSYAARGVGFSALSAIFGQSHYHTGNLAAAGAGAAALVISLPYLVGSAMKNPKLADDFIKFTKSGGTLTYAQVPYLARFIKEEGKPTSDEEIKTKTDFADDLIKKGVPSQPVQQPQMGQPQQANQASTPYTSPGLTPLTPEQQAQIMQTMAGARQGQGQPPAPSPTQANPATPNSAGPQQPPQQPQQQNPLQQ
tara:strand:+ start:2595 stop:5012 length:2418 start_codon:yes stop_codon:yes gene_type:complete